ncbi:MAG TPA: M23 family metallopeptidase [Burkholderiaceae bacterium]|nr:M23 family metallopeptidase [Burkholderiaceae bacterium]
MVSEFKALALAAWAACQRHPRRVAGALGALLLGTGVTAFGIAPLAPDAANLPVREVLEAVKLDRDGDGVADTSLWSDVGASGTHMVLHRMDHTRREDTINSLLQRMGVADPRAADYMRQSLQARELVTGRAGKVVSIETDGQHRLLKLTASWPANDERAYRKLTVERHGTAFITKQSFGDLRATIRTASGTIQSSLFAATDAARVPDTVATQLAEIFSGDIDFRRDLRKGDRFTVVYESLDLEGEQVRTGRILSAEFVNAGKTMQSVWFQEPGSKGGYFTPDGQSKRRSYLASPLEFSRVSSGYGMRFHPVRGVVAAHTGIDYAAPTGTPIRVVGDGVVEFAGWRGGYGNYIVVRHRNGQSTAYGHLSRIHVKTGQRVEQGTHIGLVGSTGVSTGPHLHFEFIENGVFRDPSIIAKQGETIPVSPGARVAFNAMVKNLNIELAAARQVTLASAQ